MQKAVQWMTLQELLEELDRTRPAWAELADLADVLEDSQLPALGEDAGRHHCPERVAAAAEQRLTSTMSGSCGTPRVVSQSDNASNDREIGRAHV